MSASSQALEYATDATNSSQLTVQHQSKVPPLATSSARSHLNSPSSSESSTVTTPRRGRSLGLALLFVFFRCHLRRPVPRGVVVVRVRGASSAARGIYRRGPARDQTRTGSSPLPWSSNNAAARHSVRLAPSLCSEGVPAARRCCGWATTQAGVAGRAAANANAMDVLSAVRSRWSVRLGRHRGKTEL